MAQSKGTSGVHSPQGQILVIGDRDRVFLDAGQVDPSQIEIRPDPKQGLQAAANRSFALVGVEVRGVAGRLGPILRQVREARPARVILLARIDEEPIAIGWVGRRDERAGADDYVICPTTAQTLMRQVRGDQGQAVRGSPSGVLQDLEARIRVLERLATEDDLTGLKNRRYLWEFSHQILGRSHGQPVRMTLFLYDIDDFKHYNDTYGHAVGDTILKEIATLMRQCCRSHDVVSRIGGDEFAVVFWDEPQICPSTRRVDRRLSKAGHPTDAVFIARRFRAALERSEGRFLGPQGKGVLTISGGLASFPQDGTTIEQLFEKADFALREAKRSGKNRVYVVGTPPADVAEID